MPTIVDPEVNLLATLAGTMQADYLADEMPWAGSPFAWIKGRPSRQIGAIGEKLIAGYLAAKGFSVARTGDSEADRLIEAKRAEVKFSTLWASGSYKFQQLRDQRYDFAVCLGLSPFDAHCWVIEKPEIIRRWRARDGIEGQHTGGGGADTAWLAVDPARAPGWLTLRGGSLSKAVQVLSGLTGFTPET